MFAMIDLAYLAGGGAAVWFGKDWMIQKWKGAEAFAASLKAKAASIEASVAAVKTAVTTPAAK